VFSPRIHTVFCTFLIPLIRATCTAYRICLNFITLIIFDEEFKLWSSSYVIFSNLLLLPLSQVKIFSPPCSQMPSIYVLPVMWQDYVSHSYNVLLFAKTSVLRTKIETIYPVVLLIDNDNLMPVRHCVMYREEGNVGRNKSYLVLRHEVVYRNLPRRTEGNQSVRLVRWLSSNRVTPTLYCRTEVLPSVLDTVSLFDSAL
jgi:hypothetical protein